MYGYYREICSVMFDDLDICLLLLQVILRTDVHEYVVRLRTTCMSILAKWRMAHHVHLLTKGTRILDVSEGAVW